jgi:hypothetical protein
MTFTITCQEKPRPKLVLVSAPPGSGKTYFASRLEGYVLIDDPKTKPIFEPGVSYVITDPKLCYRKVFDKVNSLYPEAHWIFFRPNAVRCLQNVQKRLEKEPDKFISVRELARFCSEYELNFKYYVDSVSSYQIEEIYYELV